MYKFLALLSPLYSIISPTSSSRPCNAKWGDGGAGGSSGWRDGSAGGGSGRRDGGAGGSSGRGDGDAGGSSGWRWLCWWQFWTGGSAHTHTHIYNTVLGDKEKKSVGTEAIQKC